MLIQRMAFTLLAAGVLLAVACNSREAPPPSIAPIAPPVSNSAVIVAPAIAPAVAPPVRDDDAAYRLPFAAGVVSAVGQASFGIGGLGSHANQYAIDFVMPERTPVLAARGGVVSDVRSDCPNVNCPFSPDSCCGNYIKIRHADGTVAAYWHLVQHGNCVRVGDTVERGDVIGLSGNTGISLTPHLHFMVYAAKPATGTGQYGRSRDNTMEVSFEDVPDAGVPLFLGTYTSENAIRADRCAR